MDYRGNLDAETTSGRYFGDVDFLVVYVGAEVQRLNATGADLRNGDSITIADRSIATLGADHILTSSYTPTCASTTQIIIVFR